MPTAALSAWIALASATVVAQDFRFPTTSDDVGSFYPTAYRDQGGTDWNCGSEYYSGHAGSDFGVGSWTGMDAGRDVVAAADGLVLTAHDGEYDRCEGQSDTCAGYGNYVVIQHPDGKKSYYAHLKQGSVAPAEGAYVHCGDALGQVGSSGYSTGPHLHFEVRGLDDASQDPFDGDCSAPPSYWVDQGAYLGLPSTDCDDDFPSCPVLDLVTCGASLSTTNDGAGSTTDHGWYGCSEWRYSGSAVAWNVVTNLDETVSLSLSGLSADLDLYVLDSDACRGEDCLAYGDEGEATSESVAFSAAAEHVYTVVVDGYDGAASGFTLSVSCAGGLPDADTGGGDDAGAVDTGGVVDTGEPSGDGGTGGDDGESNTGAAPGDLVLASESTGCGCGVAPGRGSGSAMLLGLGLAAVARIRSRRAP